MIILNFSNLESIFKLSPEIDTSFTTNFSKNNFELINTGTNKEQVLSLVGDPFEKYSSSPGSCWDGSSEILPVSNILSGGSIEFPLPLEETIQEEIWSYSKDGACSWFDFAWLEYRVVFLDNAVVRTEKCWHGD